jgi:hypothetical protein
LTISSRPSRACHSLSRTGQGCVISRRRAARSRSHVDGLAGQRMEPVRRRIETQDGLDH